jgi:hypothetical protein
MCLYRSPTVNFNYFLKQLELVLNQLHKASSELILCGDFNISHLDNNARNHHLESLLAAFNLSSIVRFPTRIFNKFSTLIDNFYINTSRHKFSAYPIIKGFSDHDAQIVDLAHTPSVIPSLSYSVFRNTNRNSICAFKDLLNYENWEDVFLEENVNIIFNNFLKTYLRIFDTCFPTIITHASQKLKPWLKTGIRTSCENKCKLYESYRNNKDLNEYYKKYCKILSAVIIAAPKKSTLIE